MKLKLNHRTFLLLTLLAGISFGAAAQVSVRRTPKKEKTEKKETTRKKAAETKKEETKKTDASTTQQTAVQKNTAAPKQNAAVARKTTAQKAAASQVATTVDGKTLRQQAFDEYQRQDATDVPWQHVVYRELDLTQGANASLYYPVEPQDGMTSLIRVIIDLMANNRLKVYEYLDGREMFTEKYEVKPTDVFDKFQINYVTEPSKVKGQAPVCKIDEADVPANEVLSYFVKERWEFDQKVSKYGPKILCICPVLHRSGDWGGDVVKYPMMWINYEDLRPFLRDHLIVSEGMNTAPRYTMEDYFALGQYEGEIYKVQNLRGLSLMQQYPNPDSLKIARQKIEAQLRGFGDSIWVPQVTEEQVSDKKTAARERKAKRSGRNRKDDADTDAKGKTNRRTKEEVDMEAVEAEKDAREAEEEEKVERTGAAHSARRTRR